MINDNNIPYDKLNDLHDKYKDNESVNDKLKESINDNVEYQRIHHIFYGYHIPEYVYKKWNNKCNPNNNLGGE